MSALGRFARLAVILEQDFVRCPEYRGGRYSEVIPMAIANPCIGEWPLFGGVRYSECPLREVPLHSTILILGMIIRSGQQYQSISGTPS